VKPPSTSGRGFISYRRDENDALATLLKERLAAALPDWEFFLDFGSIAAGVDFKARIEEAVDKSDLLVVLIDKNWTGQRANGQKSRIFDDEDFVRLEVRHALANDIRVLPVLVNDARMPAAGALPSDIAAISTINAVEVRISRFKADFASLVEAISGAPLREETDPLSARLISWLLGAIAAGVLGFAGLYLLVSRTGHPLSDWLGGPEAAIASLLWIGIGATLGGAIRKRWR
jgi:hypothetical protein